MSCSFLASFWFELCVSMLLMCTHTDSRQVLSIGEVGDDEESGSEWNLLLCHHHKSCKQINCFNIFHFILGSVNWFCSNFIVRFNLAVRGCLVRTRTLSYTEHICADRIMSFKARIRLIIPSNLSVANKIVSWNVLCMRKCCVELTFILERNFVKYNIRADYTHTQHICHMDMKYWSYISLLS